jgi:hypothetical protein
MNQVQFQKIYLIVNICGIMNTALFGEGIFAQIAKEHNAKSAVLAIVIGNVVDFIFVS